VYGQAVTKAVVQPGGEVVLDGVLVMGEEHNQQGRLEDARAAAELINVLAGIGQQLRRVAPVRAFLGVLGDDLDLQPERVVERNRVRRVEQRRLTPRLVQLAFRRREDNIATLAVATMPWSGVLRVHLLRVDAVPGIGETAPEQRMEAQLVEHIDTVRRLLGVEPSGLSRESDVQGVGDGGNL